MKAPPLLYVIAEYWRECPRRLRSAEKLSGLVEAENSKRKVELLALCEPCN